MSDTAAVRINEKEFILVGVFLVFTAIRGVFPNMATTNESGEIDYISIPVGFLSWLRSFGVCKPREIKQDAS